MAVAEEASAVLLIRVWLEGEEGAFRARLSGISSPGDAESVEESSVAVAGSPRDLLVAVERWLGDFVRAAQDPEI